MGKRKKQRKRFRENNRREQPQRVERRPNYGRLIYIKLRIIIVLAVILFICGFVYWFLENYHITNVTVEGNYHYTQEQIKGMVLQGFMSDNSVVVAWKYRDKSITDVPFVERMDVSVEDRHNIRITVYEKTLAGYVEYLENYMYFDKDGIIVESSKIATPGVPLVTGLNFDYVVLHFPLPVEDETVFEDILNMTQLLAKYELAADRIYFDSSYQMTLYFKNVKVALGDGEYMDEKMMQLKNILPELEGKSGVLHMEKYSEGSRNTTFAYD